MSREPLQPSRRVFLTAALSAAACALLGGASRAAAQSATTLPVTRPAARHRYLIGVSDLMLLKRQKLGAFPLARDIGADGVEVDMGGLGNREHMDNQLLDPAQRQKWLDAARDNGLQICSLAMTAFFAQDYANHPRADVFTDEWIELLRTMSVRVGYLPMGVRLKLGEDADGRAKVVARLRRAGPRAEAAGVVLGIDTGLDADASIRLLEEIGSPAVQIYYNFGPSLDAGRSIERELRTLGRQRLCQIHCTDTDGAWLIDNKRLDLRRVKSVLDEMEWTGWLVMERSRVSGKSVRENFSANAQYLKEVFQT
jgi:L-ribulose-5-phosphate 3-epimerase